MHCCTSFVYILGQQWVALCSFFFGGWLLGLLTDVVAGGSIVQQVKVTRQ